MMLKFLSLHVIWTSLIKFILYTTILLLRIVNVAVIICFGLWSGTVSHLVWIHVSTLLRILDAPARQFLVLLEVLRILIVHGEAGFAQLIYQVFNVTLIVRLRQALIYKLILLIVILRSLNSRHATGWALIDHSSLILAIRSTSFLWIKITIHFTISREAIKVWYHCGIWLGLLLISSWSTTRFKNRISINQRNLNLLEGTWSNHTDSILSLTDTWNATWWSFAESLLILHLIQILHAL